MMADEAETEEEAPKKGSAVATIAIVGVLSLLAAGGGWFVGNMIHVPEPTAMEEDAADAKPKEDEAEGGEEVKAEKAAEGEEEAPKIGVALLDPITTNLSYPSDKWIRLEIALRYKKRLDDETKEEIHQDFLGYLRTVSLQQIQGPRGFIHMREDLRDRAILRSEGAVSNIMMRTFVIE